MNGFPVPIDSAGNRSAGHDLATRIKKRHLLLGRCRFWLCFMRLGLVRRGLIHAALQNRNFLKQNAYNGKHRFL